MKVIFTLIFGCLAIAAIAQTDVDLKPKALLKVLQKENIDDFSKIAEIPFKTGDQSLIQGKFFQINSNVSQFKYIYTGRVNSCRAGGCSISVKPSSTGESEYFDYFILFDQHKTVRYVKVFNYQATHGQEITARGWLKQFNGHDSNNSLRVDKNIDAIAGATISVHAITDDIQSKTKLLQTL